MGLPGNSQHQKILQLLIDLFKKDKNISAFIIFGSLVRGNWDNYSDLDLDVIVENDDTNVVQDEILAMLHLLSSSGLEILSSFEEFPHEQVVILASLDRISIRFHTLKDTKFSILGSMRVLFGKLTKEDIEQSTIKKNKDINFEVLSNKFLELSTYVPVSLKRRKPINAMFFMNKMRQILIQIYTYSHGIEREFDFESNASKSILNDFWRTYCTCKDEDIKEAFNALLEIYQRKLTELSSSKLSLSTGQCKLLDKVRQY